MNLVQNRETCRGRTLIFFKYDVTKNTEQTYPAYIYMYMTILLFNIYICISVDLAFVSFHFRKIPGKAAIFKTITIESHPVFMKGHPLKVPHSGFPERWINDESHAIALALR